MSRCAVYLKTNPKYFVEFGSQIIGLAIEDIL